MHFVIEDKILDVNNARLTSSKVYYISKNQLFVNKELCFLNEEKEELNFDVVDGKIFLIQGSKTAIINDDTNKVEKIIEYPIILNSISEQKAIFTVRRNIKKRLFEREYIDFSNDILVVNELKEFNTLGKTFFDEKVYMFSKRKTKEILALNYQDEVIWKYDFTSLIEDENLLLESFLGVLNNKVFSVLNNNFLLINNLNTGELVELLSLSSLFLEKDVVLESLHIDRVKEVIKGFAGNFYFELNTSDLSLVKKVDFGELEEGNWYITRSTDYGNYMTFVGSKDGISTFPNSFGVFDCREGKVLWHDGVSKEEREKKGFFSAPPLMNDGKLIVVDSNRTLHIYNKK